MFMRMRVATILLLRLTSGARYLWLASDKPMCVFRLSISHMPLFGTTKREGLVVFRVSETHGSYCM